MFFLPDAEDKSRREFQMNFSSLLNSADTLDNMADQFEENRTGYRKETNNITPQNKIETIKNYKCFNST